MLFLSAAQFDALPASMVTRDAKFGSMAGA
jgi:hypothetical protein